MNFWLTKFLKKINILDQTLVFVDRTRRRSFKERRGQTNNGKMANSRKKNYNRLYRYFLRNIISIEKNNFTLSSLDCAKIWECIYPTAAMFPILGLFLASPAIPKVLDFIKPLNETRALIYLYETEYFVDQDEYYVPILIHTYMTVPLSVGSIVFFDNMLGTFIHHACAMLEILRFGQIKFWLVGDKLLKFLNFFSNYLQRIHLDAKIKRIDDPVRLDRIRKNIIRCVHMHQNSLEWDIFQKLLFINLNLLIFVFKVYDRARVVDKHCMAHCFRVQFIDTYCYRYDGKL